MLLMLCRGYAAFAMLLLRALMILRRCRCRRYAVDAATIRQRVFWLYIRDRGQYTRCRYAFRATAHGE